MIAKFHLMLGVCNTFEFRNQREFKFQITGLQISQFLDLSTHTGFSYYMIFVKSAFNILMMKLVKVIISRNCLFHQISFAQPYSSLEIFLKLFLSSFQDFRYALFLFSICLSDVYCKPLMLQFIFYYSNLCFLVLSQQSQHNLLMLTRYFVFLHLVYRCHFYFSCSSERVFEYFTKDTIYSVHYISDAEFS